MEEQYLLIYCRIEIEGGSFTKNDFSLLRAVIKTEASMQYS